MSEFLEPNTDLDNDSDLSTKDTFETFETWEDKNLELNLDLLLIFA